MFAINILDGIDCHIRAQGLKDQPLWLNRKYKAIFTNFVSKPEGMGAYIGTYINNGITFFNKTIKEFGFF